jgi:hypothetical protein
MSVTKDTLLKIAAIVNDEATDEGTRAIALLRLEEIYARQPELFMLESAPPTAPAEAPSFADVEPESGAEPSQDPEYLSFFDLDDWGRSSRNPDNLVHTLLDDTLVTVWLHRRRPGFWGWSVLWRGQGDAIFSTPSEIAAMRDCWISEIAPRRNRGRP